VDSKRRWLSAATGVLSALAIGLLAFDIWGCSTTKVGHVGPYPTDPSGAQRDIQRTYDRIAPNKVSVTGCKNRGDGIYACRIEILASCGVVTFEVPRYGAYIREDRDPRELARDKPLTVPHCPSR